MRAVRSAVTGAVLALLVLIAGAVGLAPTSAASAYDEGVILQRANEARWERGMPGLLGNGDLDRAALDWAERMAASGGISHNPDLGAVVPGGWQRIGENVAQGYWSGSAVHDGWMGSSGHRANILGDYTDMGAALIERNGTTWAVQVFAKYPGHVGPAAPAPAAPEAAPEPEQAGTEAPDPVPEQGAAEAPAPVVTPAAPALTPPVEPAPAAAPTAATAVPIPSEPSPTVAPLADRESDAAEESPTPFLATAATAAPLPLLAAVLVVAAVLAGVALLLTRRRAALVHSGVSAAGRRRARRRH